MPPTTVASEAVEGGLLVACGAARNLSRISPYSAPTDGPRSGLSVRYRSDGAPGAPRPIRTPNERGTTRAWPVKGSTRLRPVRGQQHIPRAHLPAARRTAVLLQLPFAVRRIPTPHASRALITISSGCWRGTSGMACADDAKANTTATKANRISRCFLKITRFGDSIETHLGPRDQYPMVSFDIRLYSH